VRLKAPQISTAWKVGKPLAVGLVALLAAYLVLHALGFRITDGDASDLGDPDFPPGGPAEFLYLDADRVAAYLAQVNGGTFDAERVTRKLSDSLSANLSIAGNGGGEASQSRETAVEREVKPTDASGFFSLRAGLLDQEELHEIGLRYFERHFEREKSRLEQGAFVTFKTTALLSPQYLNAYLAVREENTIEALFPDAPRQREAARAFSKVVGREPRVVFALQPRDEVNSKVEKTPFVYLLPMNAGRLTAERSLLKYGGGRFTVVGKVVRTFPEKGKDQSPAYIDSATRETWEQPLRGAPAELLCRTDPHCIDRLRDDDTLSDRERDHVLETGRENALDTLTEQTRIQNRGAVILPIAIYK
jgi:hypothetical protein